MKRKHPNSINALAVALALCSCAFADSMDDALAKVPTPPQLDQYEKIMHTYQNKDEEITHDANDLMEDINAAVHLPGVQLTRHHIDAAIVIHKRTRAAYLEYFNELVDWAKTSHRLACQHQTEKTQAYTINVSDAWLVRAQGLSLATAMDRITAFGIVQSGGGETFFPVNSDPVRYMVGREMEGLNAVCMGGQNEYEPGPRH